MFELKRYRGVMFDGTEDFEEKLIVAFRNDIKNLTNFGLQAEK